jgi:hypothetical protein
MAKYYRLEVSYALGTLRTNTMTKEDDKIEKIVGLPRSDSGAGFGMRDLGWVFELKTPAEVIRDKLVKAGYHMTRVTEYEE